MKEEKLLQLISLKLSGEASPEDLAELSLLEKDNPESRFRIALLEQLWKSKQEEDLDTDTIFDKHLQRLSNHLASPTLQYQESVETIAKNSSKKVVVIRTIKWLTSVAASIVLVAASLYFFTYKSANNNNAQNVVTTKPGSKSKILLPDGTQIWLNSESNLVYTASFGKGTREVELIGEAFFDVVKDAAKPFIIHTGAMDVKVLGTAFNVRSYPDEKTAETSLIHGIIEVTLKNSPDKKIILKPNEKLVVQNGSKKANEASAGLTNNDPPLLVLSKLHYIKNDSSFIETSWVKNRLAFEGESLSQVAAKIEKWYGVQVVINDELLKEGKYTGVFEAESMKEVMDALQLTGSFKYKINKNIVFIDR